VPTSVINFPSTQAISAASLPLPTGAASAAKQPNFGPAGTAAGDVVTIQGIAGMTAVRVDGSAVTQPVNVTNFPASQVFSAATLPLPTGAASAAKQPNFGPAGTAAGDVVTIQGIAGMTAVRVDGSAVTQPVSGSVSISGTVATDSRLQLGASAVSSSNPLPCGLAAPIPAGTNVIGGVFAQPTTGAIFSGGVSLQPKFMAISASLATDNVVVPAVVGKRIRVLKYTIVSSGVVGAKFRSGTTDLTGTLRMSTYGGLGGAYCPLGLFETNAGEALSLQLTAAIEVAGHLTYIEV
jgi:hypothetical protein